MNDKPWDTDIPTLISKIQHSNICLTDSYIESINFTAFKKIQRNSQLNFTFPLTVIVGKNGSCKSSALQALYGAPRGKSCSDFWFSTEVDPIEEVGGDSSDRPRFHYTYIKNKQQQTAYKSRIRRDKDPDYWEPTRPKVSDGAESDAPRYSPVNKEVVYIDFRAELSAYDIAYHFAFTKENRDKRKAELRKRSQYLRNLFDCGSPRMPGVGDKAGACKELSKTATEIVNWILGKKYSQILLANHSIFQISGTSVLLKTENGKGQYSEANAGSGEIAVVQLVNKLHNAKSNSLILLDEPETSIHPSAQKRLMQYLLHCVYKKKQQIVISTHSSTLISDLPKEAFKLFQKCIDSDFSQIINDTSFREAFYEIEENANTQINLVCEDVAAETILKKILLVNGLTQYFKVSPTGGAESIIKQYLPLLANGQLENTYLILDKDKQYIEKSNLQILENETSDSLEEKIRQCYGFLPPIFIDGTNREGSIKQKIKILKKYLLIYIKCIFFLPNVPEDMLLPYIENSEDLNGATSKEKLVHCVKLETGDPMDKIALNGLYARLAYQFANDKSNSDCNMLVSILKDLAPN